MYLFKFHTDLFTKTFAQKIKSLPKSIYQEVEFYLTTIQSAVLKSQWFGFIAFNSTELQVTHKDDLKGIHTASYSLDTNI